MDQAAFDRHINELDEQGYTIVPDAFPVDLADALRADLDRLEAELGTAPAGNSFEGARTWRIYNLLAHGALYEAIPTWSATLPLVEHVLDRGCLVSSLSSIVIGPGEVAQPIHVDDALMPIPRPHPATVCNTMWALTDFTEANGATRIIPGSHTRDHGPEYQRHYDSIPAEMARGSVLVWNGSLWHGGGANTTTERRYGIAMNYCAGWIRQQENQQLGLPLDTVRGFGPRLQELCGFGIYRGLMGHIDKRSPAEAVLGVDVAAPIVWDRLPAS